MAVVVAAAGMFYSASSQAAKMGVRVLDAISGLPVANASVCLGTADRPTLYGTGVTSYDGVALYDNVPERSFIITVSKRNFRGITMKRPPQNGDNVIVDVVVTEGLSSKRCRALKMVDFKPGISRGPQEMEWPLKITGQTYFPAGNDGFSFLTYSTGKPTHYRVSTRSDFKGAQWQPYSDVMLYSPRSTDVGKTKLYFQLRKLIESDNGNMEAISAVSSQDVLIR